MVDEASRNFVEIVHESKAEIQDKHIRSNEISAANRLLKKN